MTRSETLRFAWGCVYLSRRNRRMYRHNRSLKLLPNLKITNFTAVKRVISSNVMENKTNIYENLFHVWMRMNWYFERRKWYFCKTENSGVYWIKNLKSLSMHPNIHLLSQFSDLHIQLSSEWHFQNVDSIIVSSTSPSAHS